jgi:hypothetical protein
MLSRDENLAAICTLLASTNPISRAEAEDLPIVHAASMGNHQPDEDYRGYYDDGAYVVAPELGPTLPNAYGEYDHEAGDEGSAETTNHFRPVTPCEAYTNALLARFRSLRNTSRAFQSDRHLATDSESSGLQVSHLGVLQRMERTTWQRTMNENAPQPSRLARTKLKSLLSLIIIIQKQCLVRKQNVRKNISLWTLALLANIDERTIDSETIYKLRDLAKKAIWLRIDFEPRFAEASEAMAREAGYLPELDEKSSDLCITGDAEADHALEGEEMLSDLLVDENVPDDATRATLDMIVTIVGEVFGQRDLLDSRAVVDWPQG